MRIGMSVCVCENTTTEEVAKKISVKHFRVLRQGSHSRVTLRGDRDNKQDTNGQRSRRLQLHFNSVIKQIS